MELLLAFMFGSFVIGLRAPDRGWPHQGWYLFGASFFVGAAFLRLTTY